MPTVRIIIIRMEMVAVKFKIKEMLTNSYFVTMENCRGTLNDHSTFIMQNLSVIYAYSIEYVQNTFLCPFSLERS